MTYLLLFFPEADRRAKPGVGARPFQLEVQLDFVVQDLHLQTPRLPAHPASGGLVRESAPDVGQGIP